MDLNSIFPKSDSVATGSNINTSPVTNATGKITKIEPYKDKNGKGWGEVGSNGRKIYAFARVYLHGSQGTFSHILNWNNDTKEREDGSLGVLVSMVKSMRKSCGLDTDNDAKTRDWCVSQINDLLSQEKELKFDQYIETYENRNHTKLRFHE